MVHRAIKVHFEVDPQETDRQPRQRILTKGDNNAIDDTGLYGNGKLFVERKEILGVVRGYVPFLGWPTLVLYDMAGQKVRGVIGVIVIVVLLGS